MKKLKPHAVDWAQIDRFLASADKKLASARKILAFDEEACLQQAYEAMLKASLGFMFSHGFRARSQPGHHIAIIDFVRRVTTAGVIDEFAGPSASSLSGAVAAGPDGSLWFTEVDGLIGRFAQIAIRHADDHRTDIEAALAASGLRPA